MCICSCIYRQPVLSRLIYHQNFLRKLVCFIRNYQTQQVSHLVLICTHIYNIYNTNTNIYMQIKLCKYKLFVSLKYLGKIKSTQANYLTLIVCRAKMDFQLLYTYIYLHIYMYKKVNLYSVYKYVRKLHADFIYLQHIISSWYFWSGTYIICMYRQNVYLSAATSVAI